MNIRTLSACGAVIAAGAATIPSTATAIVGGHRSPTPYSFMGSLQRLDSPEEGSLHVCGVALLAPRWAITAAHCTRSDADVLGRPTTGSPHGWRVRFGATRVDAGGQLVDVARFTQLNNRYFDRDLALLRLARPVDLAPISLAAATPAPGTPARILGFGQTCQDGLLVRCSTDLLHEADTTVAPPESCDADPGNLCVGAADGRVDPSDLDSGGPAIEMQDGQWRLFGTVEGGNAYGPATYTDVVANRGWVDGFLSGATPIPADTPFPSAALAGTVKDNGCSGSVVRGPDSRPTDPAMILTAGHCADTMRRRGAAEVDLAPRAPRYIGENLVYVGDRHGSTVARARVTRLLYATMTGTDIAVARLDTTYADLARRHVPARRLAVRGPRVGERLSIPSSASGYAYRCSVQAIVPQLLEAGYRQADSIRYRTGATCSNSPSDGIGHGDSGAPLLDSAGEIVGVHATGNDAGKHCVEDNPCEIGEDGTTTSVEGRRYGQQTAMLVPCLAAGSRIALSAPGCELTRHGAPLDAGR